MRLVPHPLMVRDAKSYLQRVAINLHTIEIGEPTAIIDQMINDLGDLMKLLSQMREDICSPESTINEGSV